MINGLAKKQFFDCHQSIPWKRTDRSSGHSWPLLNELYSKGLCTDLDYFLIQRLNKLCPHPLDQEVVLFLCHLLIASREGHLSISVQENNLKPTVEELWKGENENPLTLEEVERLTADILKGVKLIPSELLSICASEAFDKEVYKPVCQFQFQFYIQKNWAYETLLLKELLLLVRSKPRIEMNMDKVEKELSLLISNGKLLKEQAEAVQKSLESSLSLITGGPGTGKTYTASQIIRIFCSCQFVERNRKIEIAIAAPTGKAVANLQKSLSSILHEVEKESIFTIKTLHSLLQIKRNQEEDDTQYKKLSADFILVDESSMIDVHLMGRLLQSVKPGARLILLGDPYQLPSVEAGSIFSNFIEITKHGRLKIAYSILTRCLRAELATIVNFSNEVKEGNINEVLDGLKKDSFEGITHLSIDLNKKQAQEDIVNYSVKYFPGYLKEKPHDKETLHLFSSIRVLSTMRKGYFGFENLNAMIAQHFNRFNSYQGWLAVPIIVVTNDYKKDLFNGETGTLMRKLPLNETKEEDYAIFADRLNHGEVRKIPAILLPRYELAYCLSVHKSQGSEFEHVILIIPEGSERFGREALYTGITRAKKRVDIAGTESIIKKTVLKKGERLSGILERIKLFDSKSK